MSSSPSRPEVVAPTEDAPAVSGEVEEALNLLGVRHVDEEVVHAQVINEAQERLAAAAKERQEKKAKDGARKDKKRAEQVPEADGANSSRADGATDLGKDKGNSRSASTSSEPPTLPSSSKRKKLITEEVITEAAEVRFGDMTPFERERQTGSESGGGGGAPDDSVEAKKSQAILQRLQKRSASQSSSWGRGLQRLKNKTPSQPATEPAASPGEGSPPPCQSMPPPPPPPLPAVLPPPTPPNGARPSSSPERSKTPPRGEEEEVPRRKKDDRKHHHKNKKRKKDKPAARSDDDGEVEVIERPVRTPSSRSSGKGRVSVEPSPSTSSSASSSAGKRRREEGGGGVRDEARSGVECMICGKMIPVEDPLRPDVEMSAHMNRCLKRRGSSRGLMKEDEDEEEEGRTRRIHTKPSKKKRRGRADSDDEEEWVPEGEDRPPRKVKESNGKRRRSGDDDNDDDEEWEPEGDEDDEEEEEAEEEEEKGKGRKRKSSAVEPSKPARAKGLLIIDDWVEEDYRRRVEDYEESAMSLDGESHGAELRAEGDRAPDGPLELGDGVVVETRINRRLHWYQRTGIRWLYELHQRRVGGILGDEMGLGKTVQMCAFLGALHAGRRFRSALVVAPATLISQWASEFHTWGPYLRIVVLHKSAEAYAYQPANKMRKFIRRTLQYEGVVCLTTYEGLRILRDELLVHPWTYVVLDEGQKIRNPDADITITAKQLPTVHRIILSGTPIQNHLKELWSLFDFVFPGRLGTLPAFDVELATPIRLGGYANATQSQAQLAYRCALVLRDLINPYLLRRVKKDIMEVLPMPKKTEQVLFCRLSPDQRSAYQDVLASPEIRMILDGRAQHFRAISILRKICNHADLMLRSDQSKLGCSLLEPIVDKDDEEDDKVDGMKPADYGAVKRSGKMVIVDQVLPLWHKQGHRVLLFSQTRQMLDILEKRVQQRGWAYLRMDGNTPVGKRAAMIDRFNGDSGIFLFLLTTKTGGLGVNLTGADRVVLFDPDWNPQTDVQARERAWRLGQTRPVTIYRLVTSGTIEEKIYQRQIFKTAISDRVLHDPKQQRLFSSRELRELFTLKDDHDGEEAPNDTTDVFHDGVVREGDVRARLKGKRKKATRVDEEQGVAMEEVETGGGGAVVQGLVGVREHVVREEGEEVESQEIAEKKQEEDDCKILKALFTGQGLSSVLSHDMVESTRDLSSYIQQEEEAKKIAQRAAEAISASTEQVQLERELTNMPFAPTWTGRSGGATGGSAPPVRFGARRVDGSSTTTTNEGASSGSYLSRADLFQSTAAPSNNILARFRERSGDPQSSSEGPGGSSLSDKYSSLMDRLVRYLRSRSSPVRSKDILDRFSDVPDSDAVIFRALLQKVADLEDGYWTLKDEFMGRGSSSSSQSGGGGRAPSRGTGSR